jgi:hypothetical protein
MFLMLMIVPATGYLIILQGFANGIARPKIAICHPRRPKETHAAPLRTEINPFRPAQVTGFLTTILFPVNISALNLEK